jgi:hypothetical protein
MRCGIDAKFHQNSELADLLLETTPRDLIEAAPDDDYWGIGHDGKGRNVMGELLTQSLQLDSFWKAVCSAFLKPCNLCQPLQRLAG